MIYFVQDSASFHIKIGFTGKDDAELRVKQLQTGCPSLLVLLAVMDGDKSREALLHAEFAEHRVQGEWFKPCPALLRCIARKACVVVPRTSRSTLKDPTERKHADRLIALCVEHGYLALSLQGPLSGVIDGLVKSVAREIHAHSGNAGMHRVAESVEDWADGEYGEIQALCVSGALDHRFDSVGGWWA